MSKIIKVNIKGYDFTMVEDSKVIFCDEKGNELNFDDYSEISGLLWNEENQIEERELKIKFVEYALKSITQYDGKLKDNRYIINHSKGKRSNYYLWSSIGNKQSLWYQGVVGILSFDINISDILLKVTIQIQSRFDKSKLSMEDINQDDLDYEVGRNTSGKHLSSKPYFLITLLLKDNIKLTESTVPFDEESIYDYLLLYLFKEHLVNATQKGLFRTYRRYEKNDDNLKGTIDIARHIKLNAGMQNGKIAYVYRENTADNVLNCLIVKAYECLKRKYYDLVMENFENDLGLKKIIDLIKMQLKDYNINDYSIINKNLRPISHPFYIEYEELRKVSIKILRDEGINIFDVESDDEMMGILYYLPDLWEDYLKDKFIKYIGNSFESQNKINVFETNHCYNQPTYPDYVFYLDSTKKSDEIFMVLDAKFKPAWSRIMAEGELKSNLPDFDKCIRDMVTTDCYATGVIFPMNREDQLIAKEEENCEEEGGSEEKIISIYSSENNSDVNICHQISAFAKDKAFYTIPISIPPIKESDDNYFNWKSDFEKEIEKTMIKLLNIFEKEKDIYKKNESFKNALVENRKMSA